MTEYLPPKVSVIIPSYNHERYVEESIRSVLEQTYENIEIIVLDDGSSDSSPEILKKLSEQYGFYYEHQNNIGLPATLNKAIKIASGDFISFVASDDVFLPDKIQLLMDAFKELNEEYAVVCGDAYFIDNDSGYISREKNGKQFNTAVNFYIDGKKDFSLKDKFGVYESFLSSNYIPILSTLIKKKALVEVGLYEENIHLEDLNMWFKLSKKHRFHYIDVPVAKYRWHGNNSIITLNKKMMSDLLKILNRERNYCEKEGLTEKWESAYFSKIFFFSKSFDLKIVLENLTLRDMPIFFRYLLLKIHFTLKASWGK